MLGARLAGGWLVAAGCHGFPHAPMLTPCGGAGGRKAQGVAPGPDGAAARCVRISGPGFGAGRGAASGRAAARGATTGGTGREVLSSVMDWRARAAR